MQKLVAYCHEALISSRRISLTALVSTLLPVPMGGVLALATAVCSIVVNAGIGVACAFIVKGIAENPDDSWTAFGILVSIFGVCLILQCLFWRRRSQKEWVDTAGDNFGELLCVAPCCICAPVGLLVGFLSTFLRLHFAPGLNGINGSSTAWSNDSINESSTALGETL